MNNTLLLMVILNFGLIGALPLVFFRRDGVYNLAWLATAAPFFIMVGLLLLGRFEMLNPVIEAGSTLAIVTQTIATGCAALSILLLGLTIGAHRIPLALWHQHNDAPVELVTWGPYARMRHPFYSSFLLAFTAAILACPHPASLLLTLYASAALTLTARREERRLLDSSLGSQYAPYLQKTGRFLPRLGVVRHG